MAVIQLLRGLFRSRAIHSHAERSLQQHIRKQRILRIVEIGVGDVSRAKWMISLAQKQADGRSVDYTGIDMFDARGSQQPPLPLRNAHCQLTTTGAAVRLIPGDSYTALSQYANHLSGRDLIVISAGQPMETLEKSWFYLPRMLGEGATVWIESRLPDQVGTSFQRLSAEDVEARAEFPKRRAA